MCSVLKLGSINSPRHRLSPRHFERPQLLNRATDFIEILYKNKIEGALLKSEIKSSIWINFSWPKFFDLIKKYNQVVDQDKNDR